MGKINRTDIGDLTVNIPIELLKKYDVEPRIVIRHPWVVGIPAPELLMDAKMREMLNSHNMEVFLVPRERM